MRATTLAAFWSSSCQAARTTTTSRPSFRSCLATCDGVNHQNFVLRAGDFLDAFSSSDVERLRSGLCFVFRDDPVDFVHVGGRGVVFENGGIALGRKRHDFGIHIWSPVDLHFGFLWGRKPAGWA